MLTATYLEDKKLRMKHCRNLITLFEKSSINAALLT